MSEKMSYESLERISRFLLLACAIFFALSACLLVHLYSRQGATADELQAQLLTQRELQTQLLHSQASDHSQYPHIDQDIGYVLNPYMKTSTWRSHAPGEGYEINSLGLRGEPIRPKKSGTIRVLLLGDSVLFGWRLKEEDTIASAMRRYLSDRLPTEDIEVLTAAMPGWNVVSEASFLEYHLAVLQPDLIIWGVVRNDIVDVPGVVPPGLLAQWNSPQKTSHIPFYITADFHKNLPMPAVLERWDVNISAVQTVEERYGIPVVLLWLRTQQRPFFELILQRNQALFPTIFIPGRFREDHRSWCIAEPDCHPSPWATNIIALGLLDKLIRLGRIPSFDFDEEEQRVVQAFQDEEARVISAEDIHRFLEGQLSKVPNGWQVGDEPLRESVVFGLNPRNGRMRQNGLLFLRDSGLSSFLKLDLKTTRNPRKYPRSAVFTVRNQSGDESRMTVDIAAAARRTEVRVALPEPTPNAVYELFWQFDFSDCYSPDSCRSGELHGVDFGG